MLKLSHCGKIGSERKILHIFPMLLQCLIERENGGQGGGGVEFEGIWLWFVIFCTVSAGDT